MLKPKRTFKMKHTRGAVRDVTCLEFNCRNFLNGWMVVLPNESQKEMIDFVRSGATGRKFIEKHESAGITTFYFHAGQNCFEQHKQRDPLFDISRHDTEGRSLWYPDGDAFVWDSDTHLRKIKAVVEG